MLAFAAAFLGLAMMYFRREIKNGLSKTLSYSVKNFEWYRKEINYQISSFSIDKMKLDFTGFMRFRWKIPSLVLFFLTVGALFHFDAVLARDFQESGGGIRELLTELFGKFFVTTLAFGAAAATVSKYLIGWIKVLKEASDTAKQLFAIGVAVALSGAGYALDLGIFADLTLVASLVQGVNVGLSSNGIYDFFNKLGGSKDEEEKS